jgi:hypothetical protein
MMARSAMYGRLSAVGSLVLSTVCVGVLVGQGTQNVTVSGNGARPLKSAVEALERHLGRTVTYEEGPWLYAGDVVDITERVRTVQGPTKRRTLVPRGGPFAFARSLSADKRESPGELLAALLADYRLTEYPGVFGLVQTGDVFHVVRVMSKNAQGQLERREPLLDALVTVIDGELDAAAMTEAILADVSRVNGVRVFSGTLPINLFSRTRVRGPSAGETARAALVRVMEATGRKLSWQLMCDAGPEGVCALNVYPVELGSGAQ